MAEQDQVVAVVTGAGRGVGLGVARAFASKGATVYVTGRTRPELDAAADEIAAAGGRAIPIACDHTDPAQVEALFAEVARGGRLDILVNNAAAVYPELVAPGGFWEKPLRLVDMIDAGLRSHYLASYYAAPLMTARRNGLIANISFYGAVSYFHGPAYGAAKAGSDKMAHDMAVDLRPYGVAAVSVWPGFVRTDRVAALPPGTLPPELEANLPNWETPEFTGLAIWALFNDPERMALSGHALIGAELGHRYGIIDLDGKRPISYRETMGGPQTFFRPPARP
jgi:NAD(P)-dependent dehydrogenase (short-subunit alcohol dehydrogenase family)